MAERQIERAVHLATETFRPHIVEPQPVVGKEHLAEHVLKVERFL